MDNGSRLDVQYLDPTEWATLGFWMALGPLGLNPKMGIWKMFFSFSNGVKISSSSSSISGGVFVLVNPGSMLISCVLTKWALDHHENKM